ncbi:MAG: hypothetical protein JWQ25_1930 [Daejeonella sp.]|nr:hypothetical protein [Daejeonella sp.]
MNRTALYIVGKSQKPRGQVNYKNYGKGTNNEENTISG